VSAQSDPCAGTEFRQFDFWLGEWNLTWPAEQTGGKEGDVGTGTNAILPLFDGCGVEESFSTTDGSFQGRSFSIYDQRSGMWKQTWVDNQGGYLSFRGSYANNTMELRTETEEREGETVVQRMVFRSITPESLKWDWQGSRDGGQNWNDLWNVTYERKV